jgi:predicted secreted acid phosphatase
MKKNQMVISSLFLVIFVIIFSHASYAEPTNIALLKEEIEAYHDSGNYKKELSDVITQARAFVIQRIERNKQATQPDKLAIILDIDETSLSNYKYIIQRGFSPTKEQLHQEVLSADAPPIKPMLSFYNDVYKQGVAVFFVTGRRESERLATKKNLKRAGYHHWRAMYLKPEQYDQPSVVPFKSETRAVISKLGYTIIASIGDQYSDLKGGYAEKSFKLPNPYYHIP